MRLRWTRPALADLAAIADHITAHTPAAARATGRRIRLSLSQLTRHPLAGRPGRIEGTREMVIPGTAFVAAYRVTETSVDILAVRHGARRWPASLEA